MCFFANIIKPDAELSERENRSLSQRPALGVEALLSGRYMRDFETYVTDQFFLRDGWKSLNARAELALGRTELSGVFVCTDGESLIERFTVADPERPAANARLTQKFAENAGVPVTLMLVPGAAELYPELLPANAQTASQGEVIENAYAAVTAAQTVDARAALAAHADERLFYRTDHHWTTLGAYCGAEALLTAWGLPVPELCEPFFTAEGFYGTAASKAGWDRGAGDTVELRADAADCTAAAYTDGSWSEIPVYDLARAEHRDKYQLFFGGNYPAVRINTPAVGEKLLIIKDSYANALAPWLLGSFSELHMLDLRYYKLSVADYIAANGIDRVLVLYSAVNFATDTNFVFMTK